jgi:hypothetical protein
VTGWGTPPPSTWACGEPGGRSSSSPTRLSSRSATRWAPSPRPSADLRRFAEGPGPAVDAVELYWLAFRRADYVALGPLDEKFAFYRHLDIWWSLVLRAGADDGAPPRGARRLDLPLVRHAHRGWTTLSDADRDRLARRNFYRVLDRFRARRDLLSGVPADGRPAGPDDHSA